MNSTRRDLIADPSNPHHAANLGVRRSMQHADEAALRMLRWASQLAPGNANVHRLLGQVKAGIGETTQSLKSLRRAYCLAPGDGKILATYGLLCYGDSHYEATVSILRRALAITPGRIVFRSIIAACLAALGRDCDVPDVVLRRLDEVEVSADSHAALIVHLDHNINWSVREEQTARRAWALRHHASDSAAVTRHHNVANPDRRLRIGYVSSDFHYHSARELFGPIILGHDHNAFEIFLYSTSSYTDQATNELKVFADRWCEVEGRSDLEIAKIIERDAIDILVDLSGLLPGNRLDVFALKAAPIQVAAWGYILGTGMKQMDYIFTDPYYVPMEFRSAFAETCVDLDCFVPFHPPALAPKVADTSTRDGKPITFGSFNRVPKITAVGVRHWAAVLHSVPGSRMVLKAPGFDSDPVRRDVAILFGKAGIEESRLCFRGKTSRYQHLEVYGHVDIALDTFPHGGGVTTWESLYMGVPMIVFAGVSAGQRASSAILASLGLEELIARDKDEFVSIANRLARDRSMIGRYRGSLRDRLLRSPVADTARYTARVEKAYRLMWKKWCRQPT